MLENARLVIDEFIKSCENNIYELPIEEAIEYAEQVGLLLRTNSIGYYSLNKIEEYLIDRVSLVIPSYFNEVVFNKSEELKCLFVASELYHTGGHTRLMERLAKFLDCKASLLITKKPSESIIEREQQFFSNIYDNKKANKVTLDSVFFNLNIILKFDVIILNIHSEDISAIIACGIAKKLNENIKIHFVNHADHLFSYGSSVADVWYEISAYGRCIDAKRNLNAEKCFLGIPIENVDTKVGYQYAFKNGDCILTAGARIKYKPTNGVDIMPLINSLLKKYNKSSLQVIGVNCYKDHWWWLMKLKYGKRLILSKSMPYEKYLKVTSSAKLYIDSHPFPGGTAFVEQYLQGRLCTGLISDYKGYSPVEVLKMKTVDEVMSFLASDFKSEIKNVNNLIVEVHGVESVKKRFLDAVVLSVYNKDFWRFDKTDVTPVMAYKITKIPVKMKVNSFKQLLMIYRVSTITAFAKYMLKCIF